MQPGFLVLSGEILMQDVICCFVLNLLQILGFVCKFVAVFLNCENTMMARTIILAICLSVISGVAVYAGQLVRPDSENYVKGVKTLNEGDPMAAYKYLNEEIIENPDNGYAHCYMALVCNCCGNVKLALQALQTSLELIPEEDAEYRSFAHYSRGVLLTGLKQWDMAESDLDEAIRLNPTDTENYKARAILFLETAEYEKSLEDLQEVLKLDSQADVNDLVLQLMASAPSSEFIDRISAAYRMSSSTEIR